MIKWIEVMRMGKKTGKNFKIKIKFKIKRKVRRTKRYSRVGAQERKIALSQHAETARALVQERLTHYNQFYNFTYGTVRIKSQTTRWGSCSNKGNLNFNYKIVHLPAHLVDYIVVHELCHLGQFNHSHKFWDLVAKTLPDYEKLRNELKEATRGNGSLQKVLK